MKEYNSIGNSIDESIGEKNFFSFVSSYQRLLEFRNIEILLEKILSDARSTLRADAGSIYAREGKNLTIKYTQNTTLQTTLSNRTSLPYHYFQIPMDASSIAGYVGISKKIINIPDVRRIPKEAPYRFNDEKDRESGYKTISLLALPILSAKNTTLGVLQLINAKDLFTDKIVSFSKRDESISRFFSTSVGVAVERALSINSMAMKLVDMAGLRDPSESKSHVNRVGALAAEIFEEWGRRKNLTPEKLETEKDLMRISAMLHDIGKVGISDLILKKPGPLSPEERTLMEQHTVVGSTLFKTKTSRIDMLAAQITQNHHQDWDGSGYPAIPAPLRGEKIPFSARIVAIADVFDALTSNRCYKKAWEKAEVIAEIRRLSGRKFDPKLVEIFEGILPITDEIRKRFP